MLHGQASGLRCRSVAIWQTKFRDHVAADCSIRAGPGWTCHATLSWGSFCLSGFPGISKGLAKISLHKYCSQEESLHIHKCGRGGSTSKCRYTERQESAARLCSALLISVSAGCPA
eukprot:gb/GFBE01059672.1/.p1 GENE.gb/GFBE01059672.1/~~gb/GFBE01059672.1/.p1  ORF type:complete len:116 (+),score=17.96 gb/GFBE01059672.1/:1-348(+)